MSIRANTFGTKYDRAKLPPYNGNDPRSPLVGSLKAPFFAIPSDTKLLLTKNYSEINVFEKLRISYVIP